MSDLKKQQDMQRLLLQIESGRRQLESMSRQSQIMESAISELSAAAEALNFLKTTPKGAELLVPVGAGSFIKVSLKDNETVIAGVGAGISTEKKLPDALQTLMARREELAKSMEKIGRTAAELNAKLEEMNALAERMLQELQSQK